MSKNSNPMKVVTGVNTRWSYVNAWEPKSINGGTPKFSVSLIIPKSDTKTVAKIKAGWDIWSQVNHLQFVYMKRHATVATDVFLTEWEDGTRLITNYRTTAFDYNGTSIGAEDYLLLKK